MSGVDSDCFHLIQPILMVVNPTSWLLPTCHISPWTPLVNSCSVKTSAPAYGQPEEWGWHIWVHLRFAFTALHCKFIAKLFIFFKEISLILSTSEMNNVKSHSALYDLSKSQWINSSLTLIISNQMSIFVSICHINKVKHIANAILCFLNERPFPPFFSEMSSNSCRVIQKWNIRVIKLFTKRALRVQLIFYFVGI